jgi:hypothetical protein
VYKLYRQEDNLYLVAITEYVKDVLIKLKGFKLVDEKPNRARVLGHRRKGI